MTRIYFANKLKSVKQTFDKLTENLTDPDLIVDSDKLLDMAKTRDYLAEVIELERQLQQAKEELKSDRQIAADSAEDSEIKNLAIAEIVQLEHEISLLTQRLNILLLPKDPLDECDVFLEVIASSNQDESSIWAGDLVRMYSLYTETQDWQVRLLGEHPNDFGGFDSALISIEGDGVYGKLKFETGIHQLKIASQRTKHNKVDAIVQTIPKVAPEAFELDITKLKIQTRFSSWVSYSVLKIPVGVKIVHLPTGIEVICTEERTESQNYDRAVEILRAKLYSLTLAASKQVEIIRTYDDRDNRITNLRLSKNFPFASSLNGNIDVMIQSCISQDQQNRLEELAQYPDTAEALN